MFLGKDVLRDVVKKVISGFLSLAPSLVPFGNTAPISFLRFVSHQEAPKNFYSVLTIKLLEFFNGLFCLNKKNLRR